MTSTATQRAAVILAGQILVAPLLIHFLGWLTPGSHCPDQVVGAYDTDTCVQIAIYSAFAICTAVALSTLAILGAGGGTSALLLVMLLSLLSGGIQVWILLKLQGLWPSTPLHIVAAAPGALLQVGAALALSKDPGPPGPTKPKINRALSAFGIVVALQVLFAPFLIAMVRPLGIGNPCPDHEIESFEAPGCGHIFVYGICAGFVALAVSAVAVERIGLKGSRALVVLSLLTTTAVVPHVAIAFMQQYHWGPVRIYVTAAIPGAVLQAIVSALGMTPPTEEPPPGTSAGAPGCAGPL